MDRKVFQEPKYRRIMSPHLLLPLAISGIIVIVVSTFLEYRSRQEDYLDLLESQATTFVKTLANTTQNAFTAASELEREISENLYSNLQLLERYDRKNRLSGAIHNDLLSISGFNEIQLYDPALKLEGTASINLNASESIPQNILRAAAQNNKDEILYVLPDLSNYDEDRLAAIISRERGGIIAGIIGAEKIHNFRKVFGFGQFLKSFSAGESVEYIALENRETIVAGFFSGYSISSFANDPFLDEALSENIIKTRELRYEHGTVLEAVAPFTYNNEPFGVLRMGISMRELEALNARAKRRMFIFSGLIFVLGLVFLNFVLSYRHRQLLRKDLKFLHEYTNTVLDNLESGVITIDGNGSIKVVNRKASKFLGSDFSQLFNKQYSVFPEQYVTAIEGCLLNKEKPENLQRCSIAGVDEKKWLAMRTTHLKTDGDQESYILLVDDVTEQVNLEEQIRRNEKLTAMRKLASAVAHEIRNPLNSINLIIDLLKMNFRPIANHEKYNKFIVTVQKEITRISTIVEEFLRFARPPKLRLKSIDFTEFFNEIETQYRPRIESHGLILTLNIKPHPELTGDPAQLKQVIVNLIENAIQASKPQDTIAITGNPKENAYEIILKDSGCGIPEKDLNNIFDIYFTTKEKGSGIGLAIVHQIVAHHHGSIEVKSKKGAGTSFLIRLPFNASFK